MNIKRAVGWAFLAALAAGRAGAVDISGNVNLIGGLFGPKTVALAVSTAPVKDPGQPLAVGGVILATQTVSVPSVGSAFSFTGLPFFSSSTTYYLFGFIDDNADQKPLGAEPMGGFGPFPGRDLAASTTAFSAGDSFTGVPVNVYERAAIDGLLTNLSAQAGERIVVRARDGGQPPEYEQAVPFLVSTGAIAYSLPGLKPGFNYDVEAWIDTQAEGSPGAYNPDVHESKAAPLGPFTPSPGAILTGVDLVIASAPAGGTPEQLRILGEGTNGFQVIAAGLPSGFLRLSARDFTDAPVVVSSNYVVNLQTFLNGTPDPSVQISADGFVTSTTFVVLPAGQNLSPPFQVMAPNPGGYNLRAQAMDYPSGGQTRFAFQGFQVLGPGAGFTNVVARSASAPESTTGTVANITPDRDGLDDGAVFTALPPAAGIAWELVISTSAAWTNPVRRYFGAGDARIFWYGEGQDGRTVPNGTYFARFQTAGAGITSASMTVTVNTAFLSGTVTDSTPTPIADAAVRVFGPGGGGFAMTNAAGQFFVGGLKSSAAYTVEISKPGFEPLSLLGQPAGADIGTHVLSLGATIRVHVDVSAPAAQTLYGGVYAHDGVAGSVSGPLRVLAASTASDNGLPAADPEASPYTSLGVKSATPYTLRVELPQHGRLDIPIPGLAPGAVHTEDLVMTRQASISGQVQFSSPVASPFGGEWISVDVMVDTATAQGPIAWGGVFINNGNSAGAYEVPGVKPGTYRLRAVARGFVTASTGPHTVVGTTDLAGVDFPTFSKGGSITGLLTINGDSSGLGVGQFGGGCAPGQVPLHINAHSRASFTGVSTQVCFATATHTNSAPFELTGLADGDYEVHGFINGFQKTPLGPLQVTVAGGVGTGNITFNALTGVLDVTANMPAGDQANQLSWSLRSNGPEQTQRQGIFFAGAGGARALIGKLNTGLYELAVTNNNPGRGLVRQVPVTVTNGSTTTVSVDMDIPTFTISGSVSIQGNVVLPSTWSVNASSMPALAAVGALPTVSVYAFPLPRNFNGDIQPLRRAPLTVHETSASFTVSGLPPNSGYLLRALEDLNPPAPACGGCQVPPGLPDIASTDRVVFLGTASATGADLTISNGSGLSGVISRPVGDTTSDARNLLLRLRRADNLSLWETTVQSNGPTASYSFANLSAGDYILEVFEDNASPKYASGGQGVKVGAGDEILNVTLVYAASVVGRLRDADSGTLITSQNAGQFLPDGFRLYAQANPWVPGGFVEADRNCCGPGPQLDAAGQFALRRLIPDTVYDLTVRGAENIGQESVSRGQRTYATSQIGGLRLGAGQILDLGTIDLNQGATLSGTVRTLAGAGLPNIRVQAVPALSNGADRHNFSVEAFTDASGKYELRGIDRAQNFYDIVAAPRFSGGELFAGLSGTKYAEERLRMVDVNNATATVNNDFRLTAAGGVLTGRILTVDGGDLVPPFSGKNNQSGVRGANVVLHFNGTPLEDNPLGEIEEVTAPDGTFRIQGLKPGAYTFRAIAVGYGTHLRTVTVAPSGDTGVGNITLNKGASISGTILKPDGTAPSTEEVGMVVGVDQNFDDFVFGQVEANADTNLVTGYSLTGFETGKAYSLMMASEKDEILEAATGVTFSASTETLVLNLVYRPSGPKVFVNQSRVGDTYTLRFFLSQGIRNLTTSDNDLTAIVTSTGGGAVNYSSSSISASRDFITVVYDAAPAEASFPITLDFFTNAVDPESVTGENFRFVKTFEFFAGIGSRRSVQIPNVTGGECSLEGVPAGAAFDSGAFDVSSSSTIEVGIQSAGTLAELPASAPGLRSPALRRGAWASRTIQRLGRRAFPSEELYKAVSLAPAVNPFSAFYDIFLPAGVNHMLKKEALITLHYDESVTDPSELNIYYFDPNNDLFLLERGDRSVDTVNRTITVSVNHLSTFVVLQSQAPIIGAGGFTGRDIVVHNIPNPFNLKSKTVVLNGAVPPQTQTTEGTVIKYALPAGKSGRVKIEIYDIAGALVKLIEQDAPTDANYYYTDWDGKNDSGDRVASGVYIARFTLNGGDEKFFKLAVVK